MLIEISLSICQQDTELETDYVLWCHRDKGLDTRVKVQGWFPAKRLWVEGREPPLTSHLTITLTPQLFHKLIV